MAELLTKRRFTAADATIVAGFDCGTESWEVAQSNWITSTKVLESIERYGTDVWLYFSQSGELVGFGSVGRTRRPHPPGSNEFANFSTIPSLAVRRQFWGKPLQGEKFSTQIMDDLVLQAYGHKTELLILDVHVQNTHAESFYREYGFSDYFNDIKGEYRRMVLPLHGLPAE